MPDQKNSRDSVKADPTVGRELVASADPERASQLDMPMSMGFRDRLLELRKALLNLHKVLLDGEKIAYEKEHGTMQGVSHYLNLVMTDVHFDWLHRISELIVQMDETLDDESSGTKLGSDLLERAHLLFQTAKGSVESEFMARYKANLQRNPGAILEHARVQRALLSDA